MRRRTARPEGAGELAEQNFAGLEVGELAHLFCGQRVTVEVTALDHEERVCLGEGTQRLRDGDRVAVHERDGRGASELVVEGRDTGVVRRDLGQRVLHHGVRCVLTDVCAQRLELSNSETAVLG